MSARAEQQAVSIARRLDLREREILRTLYEYEVLLTYQLRVLFFSSLRRCQDVLRTLRELKLIDRDTLGVSAAKPGLSVEAKVLHELNHLYRGRSPDWPDRVMESIAASSPARGYPNVSSVNCA